MFFVIYKFNFREVPLAITMGDDEEVMGFHITDQDMEESLRPGGYRRRKMSKKHSIYGVFADNTDSEEETDRPSFSSRTRKD